MNQPVDLDRARREVALQAWLSKNREDMGKSHRYPKIDLGADIWKNRTEYTTRLVDINLTSTLRAFAAHDDTYPRAIRCLAAEWVIADERVHIQRELHALRSLARTASPSLLDLQRSHLRELEAFTVSKSKANPSTAGSAHAFLTALVVMVDRLGRVGVIEPASWSLSHDTKRAFRLLDVQRRRERIQAKASVLDRQIEALNDAMSALFRGDPRLSAYDRAALAVMGVMMCAPSRINEPLCMAVDDAITIEDYAKRAEGLEGSDDLQRVHMLLLQKGSKGADWSAKPVLNFMIGLLTQSMEILKRSGIRSRMLAEWYEQNPDKLYLPDALERYRGQMIDRSALWQIVNLEDRLPAASEPGSLRPVWSEFKKAGIVRRIPNSRTARLNGTKNSRKTVLAAAWEDIEPILLRRVREALDNVRRVTQHTRYDGRISKMLMLFDFDQTPYLPSSLKYALLRSRFKQTPAQRAYIAGIGGKHSQTIFEKLDLTLVIDGRIEYAWIDTHDPRKWLSTQALEAGERLPNVLINKWANRVSIEQLANYDLRSDIQKADQAAMPSIAELADISDGLQKLEGIEAEYGLRTEIVIAHEAGVSVTSMEAIASIAEDRPVARTSRQLIILYPSPFGVCLHQHHESPCRAYISCIACSENLVIKGHLPTNDEVRKRYSLLSSSIVSQLERLVTAHNRQIADSPEGLEAHMLTLVRNGLTPEQMADELISRFHEVKDMIKSPCLRSKLEEAFVAGGMVQRLDDPEVRSGALMRYHNPARHASPGHERALDAHGGRERIDEQLKQFHREHLEFAPTSIGLKDERELLELDEEEQDNA